MSNTKLPEKSMYVEVTPEERKELIEWARGKGLKVPSMLAPNRMWIQYPNLCFERDRILIFPPKNETNSELNWVSITEFKAAFEWGEEVLTDEEMSFRMSEMRMMISLKLDDLSYKQLREIFDFTICNCDKLGK